MRISDDLNSFFFVCSVFLIRIQCTIQVWLYSVVNVWLDCSGFPALRLSVYWIYSEWDGELDMHEPVMRIQTRSDRVTVILIWLASVFVSRLYGCHFMSHFRNKNLFRNCLQDFKVVSAGTTYYLYIYIHRHIV